jgi:hypothetical protein
MHAHECMHSHQSSSKARSDGAYSADEGIASNDTHCESLVPALCLQRLWTKVGVGIARAERVSKVVALGNTIAGTITHHWLGRHGQQDQQKDAGSYGGHLKRGGGGTTRHWCCCWLLVAS